MLVGGRENSVAFGAALAAAQAETDFAQSKIRIQVFQVRIGKLRLVASDSPAAQLVSFAHANIAIGFVRVVIGKRNALYTTA